MLSRGIGPHNKATIDAAIRKEKETGTTSQGLTGDPNSGKHYTIKSFAFGEASALIITDVLVLYWAFRVGEQAGNTTLVVIIAFLCFAVLNVLAWVVLRTRISSVVVYPSRITLLYRSGKKLGCLISPIKIKALRYFGLSEPHTVKVSGKDDDGRNCSVKLRRKCIPGFTLLVRALKDIG